MTEDANKAVVILCKCGKQHRTYGIRAEKKEYDTWAFTWAFPIKEATAKREGYDKSSVKGNISFTEDFPGCPYCNGTNWTVCSCGKLNCTVVNSGVFTCEWCGAQGIIRDYSGEAIKAGMDI